MKDKINTFEIGILHPGLDLFYDDIEHCILSPLSRLRESGTGWILEFDLPMVDKKDITVSFDNNQTIAVEAKLKEIYDVEFLGCKSNFEYFKKSITLPQKVDTRKISAKFTNGILSIVIPKESRGTKIKVE